MTKQINGDKLFVIDPHPAVPPSDQLKKWEDKWFDEKEHPDVLLIQAFQAGADQELGACCELLRQFGFNETVPRLQRVRRPEPPSLKEQALADLYDIYTSQPFPVGDNRFNCIRRALEALPE
jgi:hypothetical protein